jgi:membrane protease YdiL (CAAX protease family)
MSNGSSSDTNPPAPVEVVADTPRVSPPWGAKTGLLVTCISILLGFFAAPVTVFIVLMLCGWETKQIMDWGSTITGAFVLTVAAQSAIVGSVLWFVRRKKGRWFDLGFRRSPQFKDVGWALGAAVVYFAALLVASAFAQNALGVDVDQKQELGFDNVFTNSQKILAFISLVVLPPIAEEILFRGFLFSSLRRRVAFIWTALIVSGVFASLHLMQSSQGVLWIAGIDTFILSMVLCYLRERTGNVWAGIFLHAIKNGLAFTFLYLVHTNS